LTWLPPVFGLPARKGAAARGSIPWRGRQAQSENDSIADMPFFCRQPLRRGSHGVFQTFGVSYYILLSCIIVFLIFYDILELYYKISVFLTIAMANMAGKKAESLNQGDPPGP
jgi:hypothetical protein